MIKVNDLLLKTTMIIKENGGETPFLDSKILISQILNINSKNLFLFMESFLNKKQLNKFNILLDRRLKNEPISKIIGKKCFWEYNFKVDKNVLDPRPDSENLIEAVIEDFNNNKLSIMDLGTGSGCLILTLLKHFTNSNGIAIDISEKSIEIAKKNAKNLNIRNIKFIKNNWNDNIEEKFDIIVSNPPYIKTQEIQKLDKEVKNYDPIIALDGGNDGLNCYRYIATNIMKNCKKNTKLYFEIGCNQAKDVIKLFETNNFKLHKIKKDLQNYERILVFELC